MDFDSMNIAALKAYAKSEGLTLPFICKRQEIIQLMVNAGLKYKPVDIYQTESGKTVVDKFEDDFVTAKTAEKQCAIFVSDTVYVHNVGKFDKGYHVIDRSNLERVLKSRRIRYAEPIEVARHYGVA